MPLLPAAAFVHGSPSHWAALACGFIFLLAAILTHRRDPGHPAAKSLLWILILANLTSVFHTMISHRVAFENPKLDNLLPLHLCDCASLVAAAALLTRRPLLCELTYYLGLGGTLQGLITPSLTRDFPNPVYFSFFQLHLAVVLAALFLPLGLGWRPRRPLWKTTLRVFLCIDLYLLTVLIINVLLDTNYAFLMRKPEQASLFDHLGPHPWCHLSVQGLILLMLAVLSLPFLKNKPLTPRP
ncbi:TIGR02206 family membrane protein [Roseibacillus ishigakijimensis]|uniref:TIGR02206 family membrane protein n=1 Tax=Roseibacillus ishigakijimensis TaxID=454146 RepID=A0A934VH50_9BACT|nr:TIGR02206 family membrane protein [Roseibacillus ishigakijimensis]MBK1833568.1 TIGR02206 family membrane protein [Roseibacillus ishigakijimensis]